MTSSQRSEKEKYILRREEYFRDINKITHNATREEEEKEPSDTWIWI